MTTILTNILIFIVAAIVFVWTSYQIHEIYKLPGLLIPSILSAACIIYVNIDSIACTYTEYRMANELFTSDGKEEYGMFFFAIIACMTIVCLTLCFLTAYHDTFPLVSLLECHKQVDSAFDNTPRIPYNTFKKCISCTLRISNLSTHSSLIYRVVTIFIAFNIAARGFP